MITCWRETKKLRTTLPGLDWHPWNWIMKILVFMHCMTQSEIQILTCTSKSWRTHYYSKTATKPSHLHFRCSLMTQCREAVLNFCYYFNSCLLKWVSLLKTKMDCLDFPIWWFEHFRCFLFPLNFITSSSFAISVMYLFTNVYANPSCWVHLVFLECMSV